MRKLNTLLPRKLMTIAVVSCLALAANAQIYHYILESGSTITPSFGIFPQGPSEPLTGTFTWTLVSSDANQYNFNTTSLHFQSASYSLTLNPSPYNSATAATYNWAYFTATVNTIGLPVSTMAFGAYPNQGTYEGDPAGPSRLLFYDEYLAPPGGGNYRAHVSFTAALVPEPNALAVFGLGLCALMGWRRNRRRP